MSGEIIASDNETASAVNVNQPTFNVPGISGSNNHVTINNTNSQTFGTNVGSDTTIHQPIYNTPNLENENNINYTITASYDTKNVTNTTINQPIYNTTNVGTETTINNTNNPTFVTNVGTDHVQQVPKFDEEAFTDYLKHLKIDYRDLHGKRHYTTPNMLRNIPAITKTSLEEGLKAMKGSERITDLHHLFPIIADKVIGMVGEGGSGKTTLLKLTQALFIDRGYFPFPIIVKDLGEDKTTFAYFVSMNGYKDFLIDDLQGFSEWLNKNQKRIIFLIDGLDEASVDLRANIQAVNVGEYASPHTWIAQLISHEIMRESMVVFTTRPASVFKLPISQRPDLLYALDGLDSGSMESVVNSVFFKAI